MKNIIILMVVIVLISCDTRTYEEISPKNSTPELVTYNNSVKSIVQNSCFSCHSDTGNASYYPLTNYTEVKAAINDVIDRIERPNGDPLKMPKGGSLSSSQIEIFKKWKTDGLKE